MVLASPALRNPNVSHLGVDWTVKMSWIGKIKQVTLDQARCDRKRNFIIGRCVGLTQGGNAQPKDSQYLLNKQVNDGCYQRCRCKHGARRITCKMAATTGPLKTGLSEL